MSEKKPCVSIYIPTTGRVELRYAIDSVIAQNFADWELVVCSCAKHDEVHKLVEGYNDPRIRHIPLPDGYPPNGTFDYASRHVKGDFVWMLDDDNTMLPDALARMVSTARSTNADFIAGNHLYFYDERHGRHDLRNSVGVVPYTGKVVPFDPMEGVRLLFSFERPNAAVATRFHPSAFMVSRDVVTRAHEHIGTIMIADLPNGVSSQPILLSQSRTCVILDVPVVVVGRLGISMSQVWSTAARARFRKTPFPLKHSPVTGYTRINGTIENYLRLKVEHPDIFDSAPIGYDMFATIYLRELSNLDMEFGMIVPVWRNAFSFISTLPEPGRSRLRAEAVRGALRYPLVFMSRRLRLHQLKRAVLGPLKARTLPDPRQQFKKNIEFVIPLAPYGIHDISALTKEAFAILTKELGESAPSLPPAV